MNKFIFQRLKVGSFVSKRLLIRLITFKNKLLDQIGDSFRLNSMLKNYKYNNFYFIGQMLSCSKFSMVTEAISATV